MDIGSYRCPDCGTMIEGAAVGDPTLPGRIDAHRAACGSEAMAERRAVVAWLRQKAEEARAVADCGAGAAAVPYAWLATAAERWAEKVEAGEHREARR
jgi:hypothetical protein